MEDRRLRPSQIKYCQNSISNVFRFGCGLIGVLLDDICEGRKNIEDIQKITVANKDGEWISLDNRRLWVFKQLERLGRCYDIPVYVTSSVPENKHTAKEDTGHGATIKVLGEPGGSWHLK